LSLYNAHLLVETHPGRRSRAQTDDGIHYQRKGLVPEHSAAPIRREKKHLERRLALEEKVRKQGLAGQKLGKHKVPQGEVEVQLGEELSRTLRELKVILLVFLPFPRVDVFSF
jgi:hypothetical protein